MLHSGKIGRKTETLPQIGDDCVDLKQWFSTFSAGQTALNFMLAQSSSLKHHYKWQVVFKSEYSYQCLSYWTPIKPNVEMKSFPAWVCKSGAGGRSSYTLILHK